MGLPPAVARSLGLAVAALVPAAASFGAVSLTFSDKDATPTSVVAGANTSFTVDVFLNLSATTDRVSIVDYRLQSSVAGRFQLTSRTSTSVLAPYKADSDPAVAPVAISPSPANNTTDLGGPKPASSADLAGVNNFDVAAYVIKVLAGTPNGTYTLSFVPANTTYVGSSTGNLSDTPFSSLGTFTITVPEPTTLAAVGAIGGVAMIRRRRAR